MPPQYRRILQGAVFLQIAIVAWDALALAEPYGLRRAQYDGIFYLTAAHGLLQGELLRTLPYHCTKPPSYRWHYEWPIGYPSLIAGASWLGNLPPFYASRWLNVFLYVLAYGILWLGFRGWAEWLFLTLFTSNVSWMVGFVLSEVPYLSVWIACVLFVERLLRTGKWSWGVGLAAGLIALFLVRYNGLAMGAAAGLLGLGYVRKGPKPVGGLLLGAAAVQIAFAGLYFAWNAYHNPLGYSGLSMYPPMPVPDGWMQWLWGEARYLRYAALVGLLALLAHLWRRRVGSESVPFSSGLAFFLAATAAVHAFIYASGMLQDRIGILDERHLFPILLPLLWVAWWSLGQNLPPKALLGVAVLLIAWQLRNTYAHYKRASAEGRLFPYASVEKVRQAYDTLPPGSCVIAPNLSYALVARRRDLCFPEPFLNYSFLMCERCTQVYVDCGMLEERMQRGLTHVPFGVAWKVCGEAAQGLVDLRRYPCEKSP